MPNSLFYDPTALLSAPVLRFEQVESTNATLRKLAIGGASIGTAVIATEQTAGRGRNARTWVSQRGGLYCSFLLEAYEPKRMGELSLLAAVAVFQTLRDFLELPEPQNSLSLKWPNDCLLDGQKISGILCEVAEAPRCILGIGINVATEAIAQTGLAERSVFPPIALASRCGTKTPSVEAVFQSLRSHLVRQYGCYSRDGFDYLRDAWESRCAWIGSPIAVDDGTRSIQGYFSGLAPDGALRLRDRDRSAERVFYSGEVRCSWL